MTPGIFTKIRDKFKNHLEEIVVKETDTGLEQIDIAKKAPVAEFILMTLFKIVLIIVFYRFFGFIAKAVEIPIKDEILYTLATFPLLTLLKTIPETFHSCFVEIFISKDYIVKKEGIMNINRDKLYLSNIDNIELYTTFFGKLFGYSHVQLLSFGGSVTLPYIANSIKNKTELEKIIKKVNKERYEHSLPSSLPPDPGLRPPSGTAHARPHP